MLLTQRRFISASIFCLTLGAVPAIAGEAFQAAVDRGAAARRAGDFPAAESAFAEALKTQPDNAEVLNSLALVQGYQNHTAEALRTIEHAEALAPKDLDIALTKARVLAWSNRYVDADRQVNTVLAARPQDGDALALKGRIAFYRGDTGSARDAFKRALAQDPNNLDAVLGLGDVARAGGNEAEAQSYFQKGQAIDPGSKDVADRLKAQEPDGPLWRLDASLSHSWLRRTTLADWSEQSATLQHRLGASTSVSLGAVHAHRFGRSDVEVSGGIIQAFSGIFRGELGLGVTPKADFLPQWRIAPTVAVDVFKGSTLLLEGSVRDYSTGTVGGFNVGGIQSFFDGRFDVTERFINSFDPGGRHLTGWSVGASVSPIDRFRLRGAYADAPESDAGIVAGTRSWSTGLSFDLTQTLAIHLDYNNLSRKNSYKRDELVGGVTLRF